MLMSRRVWQKEFDEVDFDHSWTIKDIAFLCILCKYVKKGDKVLDAGCGTGKFDLLLTRKGAYTVLLDFSLQVLRTVREIFNSLARAKRLCYPKPDDPLAIKLAKAYFSPILGFWLISVGMKK